MKGDFVLRRWALAASACLLLIGIVTVSLVWAAGPSSAPTVPPAGDTSPVGVEDVQAVALARAGNHPAPVDPPDAKRAVREAWEKARDAGVYGFATSLTQMSYPALTLSNAGRGPQRAELHLEGEIDQPARTMTFRLSQPGADGSGAEVRVVGDRAYTRRDGGDWQEVQDFSSSFAPDNDPLAFLAGIKGIAGCDWQARAADGGPLSVPPVSSEGHKGEADSGAYVACYRFNLDGPALAAYLRDRMQRQLAGNDGLPPGMSVDAPESVREMTGNGELWVDGRGLPLRLTMHLVFPQERDGSHSEADVQTAFSGFPQQEAAASSGPAFRSDPVGWASATLGLDDPSTPGKAAQAAGVVGVLACTMGAMVLLVVYGRSPRLYIAVAIAVILSMVVVPALQGEQVSAYYDRREARSKDVLSLGAGVVDAQAAQEEQAAQQSAAEALSPTWDPLHDPLQAGQMGPQAPQAGGAAAHGALQPVAGAPLAAALGAVSDCDQQQTGDTDADGVSDYEECVYGLSSSTADNNNDGVADGQDTDGDGLTDSQELNKLGTNPTLADTDGDLITDTLEVQGFQYGSQRWYLDPNSADTNNDEMADSAECSVLLRYLHPTYDQIKAECDTDGDEIPNPFEVDNDGDGVPDSMDLSPDEWLDGSGPGTAPATSPTPFTRANPFKLAVPGLQDDRPVLLDVQFRPVEADHLSYAMNVLDWPPGDVSGQIQHAAKGTFAHSNNPEITNPDDTAGANGDMRLMPLLEIVMTGDKIPLKLTDLAPEVSVGSGTAVSGTVTLRPGTNAADTQLTFLPGATLDIYYGTCPASGEPVKTFTDPTGSETWTGMKVADVADGNHAAVVTLGATSECATLPDVVTGRYTDKMVDMSVLDPYGIVVKQGYGNDDTAVVAYVSPEVVADDTGGGKTAFQARMLYWVGGQSSWNEPAQMRVIWLVQVITDSCVDGSAALTWEDYLEEHPAATRDEYNDYVDAYCRDNRTVEEIVPAQVYDESWYVTGLSVQEAHGLDVAVAYPDPALGTYDDDALWTLAWGLGRQFIAGRDCLVDGTDMTGPASSTCTGDAIRDLSVYREVTAPDGSAQTIGNSTIQERFDAASSGALHSDYRWGIAPGELKVKSFRYPHSDYAGYLAMVETPKILEDYATTVTPTLLFAYEERVRSANLVSGTLTSGVLTLDMAGSKHPEDTVTGFKWAPYYYDERLDNGQPVGWQTYPTDAYWTAAELELTGRFQALFPGDSDNTTLGRVATARSYAVGLIVGVGGPVYCTPADHRCPVVDQAGASDRDLGQATASMLGGLNHVTVELMSGLMDGKKQIKTNSVAFDQTRIGQTEELRDNVLSMTQGTAWAAVTHPEAGFFEALGAQAVSSVASPWQTVLTSGPALGSTYAQDFESTMTAITTFVKANALLLKDIAYYVFKAIYAGIAVGLFIKAVYTLATAIEVFLWGLAEGGKLLFGFVKNIKTKGGVLGTVVSVLTITAAWAKFFAQIALAPGSLAFDEALTGAIATTVVTVVLSIITTVLGPYGTIISAIKMLLNTLAGTLCRALLTEQQREKEEWAQWVCGGVTGMLEKVIENFIYSGTILVDMDPYETDPWYPRLNMYGLQPTLVNEEDGMVVGNHVRYSVGVTTTIMLVDPPHIGHEAAWNYQFSDENLETANFDYKWQNTAEPQPFHDSLNLGGMSWDGKTNGPPFYHAETVATEQDVFLPQAGINVTIPNLYLSEAYAVPEQECWGLGLLKYCYIPAERDTLHYDMGSNIRQDVLPNTLTGFYTLARKGKGYALAWGQGGDLTFPTLTDGDGDGLSLFDDPDDHKWDADGDGLSDAYELDNGMNALEVDADADGLTDLQEVRLGTDPWSRDTDGDGLLDCQEVWHQVLSTGDNIARALCGPLNDWSGGWDIVYKMDAGTQLTTRVTSDPLAADTDADGLNDSQERTFAYNPRLYSSLNVLSLESTLTEPGQSVSDGIVLPGQTLAYTATVKNELDRRRARGLLSARSPILDTSGAVPQSFDLSAQAQVTMTGDLVVGAAAASGTYSLTQVAGALISNPDESRRASLWLPFDSASGSVYPDTSGSVPAHDGHCIGTCTLEPTGGRIGGAVKLDGAGSVRSYAAVPNDGFSVSLWFKASAASLTSGARLFGTYQDAAASSRFVTLDAFATRLYVDTGFGTIDAVVDITADTWHHVALTDPGLGGGTAQMILYLDGAQVGQGARTDRSWGVSGPVFMGGFPDGTGMHGSIDDLRLFENVLTPGQVAMLYNTPLFHMDFADSSTWKDVSDAPATVVSGTQSPGHIKTFGGGAAAFNGTTYLTVSGADKLNLSGGRLTLAAWIYPKTSSDSSKNSAPQAILGASDGGVYSYPTLQRVGNKIRFGMSTTANTKAYYQTSANVLTANQWNHVAVTYDQDLNGGTVQVYVNGDLKETTTAFGLPASLSTGFEIGRSGNTGNLDGTSFNVDDMVGNSCNYHPITKAILCMAMNKVQVVYANVDQCGEYSITSKSLTDKVDLVLWEDDGDPACGAEPSDQDLNDDNECEIKLNGTSKGYALSFTTNDAPFTSREYSYWCDEDDTGGDFKLTLSHDSIPFNGNMDEVWIYGQALGPNAIKQLYLDIATELHLPLDEPPGASAFRDLSMANVPARCSGECPESGSPGRLNGAAWFDGQHDGIEVVNFGTFVTTTVAAWVYQTADAGSYGSIVSYKEGGDGTTTTACGSVLRLNSSVPVFYVRVGSAWKSAIDTGHPLPLNQWVHLAGTYDGSKLRLYRDGTEVATADASGSMTQCTAKTGIGIRNSLDRWQFPGLIDDVWIMGQALSATQIGELYDRAPDLHLRFEEDHNATQFADNASPTRFGICYRQGEGTCTAEGGCCPVTGEGVRGQIGLAARFDGVDDVVKVDSFGDFTKTTVSAWVYRTGATATRETIVSYKESVPAGFLLDLNDENPNHYPRFYVRVGTAWKSATDTNPLPLNQWVHLAGTYDGSKLRLYRNGNEVATADAAGSMTQGVAPIGIGSRNSLDQHWFPGQIDEVRVYDQSLTAEQIKSQHDYESAWFEDRQTQQLTVDNDDPTAELLMPVGSYLANQEIVVGMIATDTTSYVDRVELGVQQGAGPATWSQVARCVGSENQPEGAWCAQFTPSSQGQYTLYTRATDRVGHVGPSDQVDVLVDDTPPDLALDQADLEVLNASQSADDPNIWLVHLSGTTTDPDLAPSIAGSGVPTDGVHVTLFLSGDADGKALGDVGQTAAVSPDGTWSLDYRFKQAEGNGVYEVEVEAVDRVARIPDLDATQVTRHTRTASSLVVLDASAPKVVLDQVPSVADKQLDQDVTTLGGAASDRAVDVRVVMAAKTNADQTRVWLTCPHAEGTDYTLLDLPEGALQAGDTPQWEGEIRHGSACQVNMTTSAATAEVTGTVKVCDEPISSWQGSFSSSKTVAFTVHSGSCWSTAATTGSGNDPPWNGELLRLSFEDDPGSLVFRDTSGNGNDAACPDAARCPAAGQPGHAGNGALFDGTDDYAEVPLDVSETAYGLSLWFKTTCSTCGIFSVDKGTRGSGGHDRHLYLNNGQVFARIWSNEILYSPGTNYADGQWHHVVHTFGGTEGGQKLYLDGVLSASGVKAASDFTAQDGINIGFSNDAYYDYFYGVLDEVRIFSRALTADDVRVLYFGSGPVPHLPFDTSPATDGTILPDVSGWGYDGTLETGTGDTANKAVSGQVGPYALSFDGTDDYVNAGSGISLANASFSVAFWAKRDVAGRYDLAISQGTPGTNTLLHIGFRNNNQFTCAFYGNDLNTTKTYTDTDWHHWACTYDSSTNTRTIYRDGAKVVQGVASADYQGSGELYVGRYTTYYFRGSLDDLRIYPRVLGADEVEEVYGAGWQSAGVTGVQGVDLAFRSVLPGSVFLNEVPTDTEVLHLPFEDGTSGNGSLTFRDVSGAVDASGNPVKGVCGVDANSGCPSMGQAGPSGEAAWFDGVNDYVSVAGLDATNISGDFTVAGWFSLDALGGWTALVSKDKWSSTNGWGVLLKGSGGIRLYINYQNVAGIPGPGWVPGRWYHYAFTRSGDTLKGYLNGVEYTSSTKSTATTSSSQPLTVGKSAGYFWPGKLDDVRIFNQGLTADQVKALYFGSGPLLALPFEEPGMTDGAILPDASGWEHNGTLETGTTDTANKAAPGQVGSYALALDGDDYVSLGDVDALDGLRDFTIAQWFYLDALTSPNIWAAPVGKGGWDTSGWSVLVEAKNSPPGNDRIRLYLNGGGTPVASIMAPTDGWQTERWYQYAFTRNGGTITGYLDGVQKVNASYSSPISDNTDPVLVGKNANGPYYWPGRLDDLRIYGRALPAVEIADLYHAGWQAATLPSGSSGAESASWTATVPAGLEGSYQVEMRGQDVAGHVEAAREPSLLWRGEADNLPPRVTLTRTRPGGGGYKYTTVAEDYHLLDPTVAGNAWAFTPTCDPLKFVTTFTKVSFQSPWYLGRTGDPKLYRLTAECTSSYMISYPKATVCDSFGNCTTCDTDGTCANSKHALAAPGNPQAGAGAATLSGAKPAGKPPVRPGPAGFDITAAAVVTASQYYEPRTIDLSGLVTSKRQPGAGKHDLVSVQVTIGDETGFAVLSEPAEQRPYTVTWTFAWHLPLDSALPDGVPYTAVITATDQAVRTTVLHHTLTADVVLPTPVTLGLTANGQTVEPGAIIREPGAALELSWTPSSDGSGLAPYLSGWRFEDAYTTTTQIGRHDPAGPLAAQATTGEAQRISTGVASRDLLGNTRVQAFGSIIVDGPLTPDYIAFSPGAEGDLTGSSCTLLGVDRRIAHRARLGRWIEQRLYGTWDHQALRLAWTGANWSGDGDLFLYLDTVPGGTNETFTPFAVPISSTQVALPLVMQADVLIWVQDASTASLLRSDGSAWITDTLLSPDQYRFDGGLNSGQTDLYLPFEWLGTVEGAPLGLVAFATEEPVSGADLKLWATAPLANPVNSDRVNIRRVLAPGGAVMPLLHAYRWDALADNVCPNGTNGVLAGEQNNDAMLEMSIDSNPPAASASGLASDLFWIPDPGAVPGGPATEPIFGLLTAPRPSVRDGQVISYTLHYRNEGSQTLQGATLALTAYGATMAVDTIGLGDVLPGGEGAVTFQATVDRSLSAVGLTSVVVRLYAANNAAYPLEWLIAAHRIDLGAPEEVDLDRPDLVVGPGAGRLRGLARDESGVSQVEIEITAPSGLGTTLTCQLQDPGSGGWSCPWDATAANGGVRPANGDTFTVRLRATDRLGYTSDWSPARIIRVDAQPPTVTLDIDTSRLVRGNSLRLTGKSLDNHAVGSVTLCLDDGTCRSADLQNAGAGSSWWSRRMIVPGALDYVTRTLTISATDRLGNGLPEPLALRVVFDGVAPVLTATQRLAQVPADSAETVLSGDVTDGGPGVDVSLRVQPPRGEPTRVGAARDGSAWWFDLPAATPGQYILWADAEDVAGNLTTAGPFTVTVTCTDAAVAATSLTAEPVAGRPLSLTLTVVISNAGPEALPEGLPVVLDDGVAAIGRVTTTAPLPAGGSEALSLVWAPGGARDYAIGVAAGPGADLPNGPLCVVTSTVRFELRVRDQELFYGWNLIAPRLNPGNTDVEVVQRGIDVMRGMGYYTAILGYDGGLLSYPDRPGYGPLTTVDALHGYWIQAIITPTEPLTETRQLGIWRMTGEILPENLPLSLDAGWNLAGYLPARPLTVTTALEGIDGQYGAVLGFDHTALSYYPGLDPSYNTLVHMLPAYGYWISATQPVTLAYPVTDITGTLSVTATQIAQRRPNAIREAERQAGVQPTYAWMNFYGQASLSDGTPVPTGTVVLAVDPAGTICGATAVWQPGQFGLLACYRDDPGTGADEGALPGDTIQLWIPSDGTLVGQGVWTAHGGLWMVAPGAPPAGVDLAITKEVLPLAALPGQAITYTLHYWNEGDLVAEGVVITEVLPAEIVVSAYAYAGAPITLTAGSEPFVWQVADLAPGAGGIITVTGVLSPALTGTLAITNTAIITAPGETQPENNVGQAILQVAPEALPPVVDLGITKQVVPVAAYPGDTITYTLFYWNEGDLVAQGVVISEVLPAEIVVSAYAYAGAPITLTAGSPPFVWQVADLPPGAGGIITVTASLSPALTGTLAITNTAIIRAPLEAQPQDNVAQAVLHVMEAEAPPPVVDLAITKEVVPQEALPGAAITYTLVYWNAGSAVAQGVVLSDVLPPEIVATGYTYSGAIITPTVGSEPFVWEVADLEPGAGGIITVTGILSPALTGTLAITNTAVITAPGEAQPEDNLAQAILQAIQALASLWRVIVHGPL
jgi:uncharacterized repeat protein (TIGR01451 family)